jgi:hypothetical protein
VKRVEREKIMAGVKKKERREGGVGGMEGRGGWQRKKVA